MTTSFRGIGKDDLVIKLWKTVVNAKLATRPFLIRDLLRVYSASTTKQASNCFCVSYGNHLNDPSLLSHCNSQRLVTPYWGRLFPSGFR
jgi:hypothetical protein